MVLSDTTSKKWRTSTPPTDAVTKSRRILAVVWVGPRPLPTLMRNESGRMISTQTSDTTADATTWSHSAISAIPLNNSQVRGERYCACLLVAAPPPRDISLQNNTAYPLPYVVNHVGARRNDKTANLSRVGGQCDDDSSLSIQTASCRKQSSMRRWKGRKCLWSSSRYQLVGHELAGNGHTLGNAEPLLPSIGFRSGLLCRHRGCLRRAALRQVTRGDRLCWSDFTNFKAVLTF